jgi:hypothetical protein
MMMMMMMMMEEEEEERSTPTVAKTQLRFFQHILLYNSYVYFRITLIVGNDIFLYIVLKSCPCT